MRRALTPVGSAEAYLSDHRFRAEASLGVALMEADLLMCLARVPAADERQFRLRAALFRCVQPDIDGTNLAAMLMAALHADAVRLGLAAEGTDRDAGRA